jgi:hypothetical protein
MSKLVVHSQKGFQITFANGYEVSVMFGPDNYCQKRYTPDDGKSFRTSEDCEVAVFLGSEYATGNFDAVKHKVDPQGMVAGWVTPDEVAFLMAEVASYKG